VQAGNSAFRRRYKRTREREHQPEGIELVARLFALLKKIGFGGDKNYKKGQPTVNKKNLEEKSATSKACTGISLKGKKLRHPF